MSSPKPPKKISTKSTTCLCGAVSLSVTGVDKGAVLCHCSNCQKGSGSAFAHNYRLLNTELKFDRGEDKVRAYEDGDTKSGKVLVRHFCTTCGCPLFMKPQGVPGMVVLHTGGMQDKTQPIMELFQENKMPWIGDVVASKARL